MIHGLLVRAKSAQAQIYLHGGEGVEETTRVFEKTAIFMISENQYHKSARFSSYHCKALLPERVSELKHGQTTGKDST